MLQGRTFAIATASRTVQPPHPDHQLQPARPPHLNGRTLPTTDHQPQSAWPPQSQRSQLPPPRPPTPPGRSRPSQPSPSTGPPSARHHATNRSRTDRRTLQGEHALDCRHHGHQLQSTRPPRPQEVHALESFRDRHGTESAFKEVGLTRVRRPRFPGKWGDLRLRPAGNQPPASLGCGDYVRRPTTPAAPWVTDGGAQSVPRLALAAWAHSVGLRLTLAVWAHSVRAARRIANGATGQRPAAPFIPPVWYRARPWDPPITNDAAWL
jgi:hypothetical protein